MSDRVVLAFSGGLDTSVAIGWIKEQTGAEVIALAVDVGQGGEDMDVIRERAIGCGAVEAEVADVRDEFADEYCLPALKADALYMDRYPLVSALSRPVIVKHLVEAAHKHNANVVAHGCTGKGNDQVRFEVGIRALSPDLKCIAPVRDLALTRDKAIEFAEREGLPIDVTKKSPYSIDQNVWGRAVETGFLEDIWNGPTEELYTYSDNPATPREPDEVVITFEHGVPVAIDGEKVSMLQAIEKMNERAGGQGIGRIGDLINGEHLADKTGLPWGVKYLHPDSPQFQYWLNHPDPNHPLKPLDTYAVHPVAGGYELLGDFVILALLLLVMRRIVRVPGWVFCSYVAMYGVLRFILSYFRFDEQTIANVPVPQLVSGILLGIAVLAAGILYRKPGPLTPEYAERVWGDLPLPGEEKADSDAAAPA